METNRTNFFRLGGKDILNCVISCVSSGGEPGLGEPAGHQQLPASRHGEDQEGDDSSGILWRHFLRRVWRLQDYEEERTN